MAPAGNQASTVAKVALGMNLGIILGAPIGTFIGHNLGWRATFTAIAAVSTVALLLVLRFVPAQPVAAVSSVRGELRVFADRGVQLAIALTAVGNVGIVTVFTYITPLLTEVSGFAPTLAVAVNASGFQLAAAFAGWLGGQVISSGLGLRSIYLVGAFLTVAGLAIAVYAMRRDRQPTSVHTQRQSRRRSQPANLR
jgi:MFS transporter, DHA1 family, inner membrane transport protein